MSRWLAIDLVVASCVIGAGVGYALGHRGGVDVQSARTAAAKVGVARGMRRGTAAGYAPSFAQARKRQRALSYKQAYRIAYRQTLKQGKTTVQTAPHVPKPVPILDCPGVGGPTISNVSVRYMTCGQGQGIIDNMGAISAHFTVLGFTCDRQSGGDLGGTWRCTRNQQALRFDFAD